MDYIVYLFDLLTVDLRKENSFVWVLFLCLQSTSANADKVCRHCFYKCKFADMQTYGYARCTFTKVNYMFRYTYLLLAVSYEILRVP